MSYIIGLRTAVGYSEDPTNFGLIEKAKPYGDFIVRKEYKVSNRSNKTQPVNGIIIQYVKKTTEVIDAQDNIYNTTASINSFTNNKVDFSNDSYFEMFELMEDGSGESKDSDRFQNGALVRYDSQGPLTFTTNDKNYKTYKTEGHINVIGENCFISASNPNLKNIKNLKWNRNPATPANGLLYLPYSAATYNSIFSVSDSPILVHDVHVDWDRINPTSIVMSESSTKMYARKGGRKKRKTYRKSKSYRKRKTYKKK